MQSDPAHAPHIERLIDRLRSALVRQIWLHGLGTVVSVTSVWVLFAFLADWLLHLPAPIRVLHGLVLVGLPIWLFQRHLLRHLRRVPGRAGLAQLLERGTSDSEDLLVSAVQLAPLLATADVEHAPLIRRLLERAEAKAKRLDVDHVLARRGPGRRALAGAGGALLVALGLVSMPELGGIFLARLFGSDTAWPQRTYLHVEVPAVGELVQVERSDDEIHLRVARGSDVPVLVRADGVVPSEVALHFDSGHQVVLGSGGGAFFRTRLPAVQEDTSFHVTGGDDRRGKPVVHLTVLRPPDVAGLAVEIEPPAYSGLPARLERGGDVLVLQGSRLKVHLLPDPAEATGFARILPSDVTHALAPTPFPSEVNEDGTMPAPQDGLGFSLVAEESARYRFELTDESGLPNPDPGLYAIEVLEDARPELVLVSPSRAELDVVLGGAMALRVRVSDDFGIERLDWSTRATTDSEAHWNRNPLALRRDEATPTSERRRDTRVVHQRVEIADLFDGAPTAADGSSSLAEGASAVLQLVALDNRRPTAGRTASAPVRLNVVSADDFLRRLQDSLARSGELASRLANLESQKLVRSQELLAALGGEEADAAGGEIGQVLSGLRRVQGDAGALTRDLAAIAESLLYSRADDRADALLDFVDAELARVVDRSFHTAPWLALAEAYARGDLGRAGLAGQLVEIVGLALSISEDAATDAVASLETSGAERTAAELRAALGASIGHQERAIERTTLLLERLAEWDNLNSILTLTRDILNQQKNLTERTRQFAKDN